MCSSDLELARIAAIAREMTLVVGLCESDGAARYNTAVAVGGDGVLGFHRKVHQPLGENLYYDAGDSFAAIDTPAGRLGLLICYDKAFPESARALALDGAAVVACISAWPASRTATAASLDDDRWTHRFNLFDAARALIRKLYIPILEQVDPRTLGKDAKTLLQEYLQGKKIPLPQYNVVATHGAAHNQEFEIECLIPSELKPESILMRGALYKHVSVHGDGSVEGDSGYQGIEYVVLCRANDLGPLAELCSRLRSVGAKVNRTCGLHVHLDCRGWD